MFLSNGIYKNSKGYTYPIGMYVRQIYTPVGVAITSHTLASDGTLSGFGSGFNEPIPAGTVCALTKSAGVYLYPVTALSGSAVPEVWTRYTADIAGSSLRPGTALVRPGWQFNRSSSAGNVTAVSSINLREI